MGDFLSNTMFSPHFQLGEKIEMKKDVYMYYIKINKS